jgi:hypothetical protein
MRRCPPIAGHSLIGDLQTCAPVSWHAGHAGLFAEEIGATGEHPRDFPHAFTPLAPVVSALAPGAGPDVTAAARV